MFVVKIPVLAAMVFGGLGFALPAAQAAETVAVSLWDKGDQTQMPMNLGIAMGGDIATATMGITATPASVKAGEVTFAVTNASTLMVHEMVVLPATPDVALAYDEREMEANEDAALGEVAELDPGKSGEVTLTLAPGTYALICNVPGHYAAGMWTMLTVTP